MYHSNFISYITSLNTIKTQIHFLTKLNIIIVNPIEINKSTYAKLIKW